jgi:hypothetical protein
MRSITRRTFLIIAPAAAAGASLLAWAGYPRKTFASDETDSVGGELAHVVEEYFKNFPQERDVRVLCESIGLQVCNSADRAFLSEPAILARIQQDFTEERTVSVAGWILSRTEVRVLALLHLLGR